MHLPRHFLVSRIKFIGVYTKKFDEIRKITKMLEIGWSPKKSSHNYIESFKSCTDWRWSQPRWVGRIFPYFSHEPQNLRKPWETTHKRFFSVRMTPNIQGVAIPTYLGSGRVLRIHHLYLFRVLVIIFLDDPWIYPKSTWATKKKIVDSQWTGWLIGILILVCEIIPVQLGSISSQQIH